MSTQAASKPSRSKKPTAIELLREQKLDAFRRSLAESLTQLAALKQEQNASPPVDVVGLTVTHKVFGAGTVAEQNKDTISVKFSFGSKRFLMPSAFTQGFLQTEDAASVREIARQAGLGEKIKALQERITADSFSIKTLESK